MHTIDSIEGIGPVSKVKFQEAGITTIEDLLHRARTPNGLASIAKTGGFNETNLLKWAGMADLFRIKGISTQWSELLSACGVRSVKELSARNPKKLHRRMTEFNEKRKICKSIPQLRSIKNFIEQAKELPKINFT